MKQKKYNCEERGWGKREGGGGWGVRGNELEGIPIVGLGNGRKLKSGNVMFFRIINHIKRTFSQ